MSQTHNEYYDQKRDPSFQVQEVSPGNPYNAGPQTYNDPHLSEYDYRNPVNQPSRARMFIRKLFFGNTRPGTPQRNRTAFMRGLAYTALIALIIAIPFVVIAVLKGLALVAITLPLAMFVLAAIFIAGAAMCIYNCCMQCRGSRRTHHYEQTVTRTNDNTVTTTSTFHHEQDVQEFATDPRLLQPIGYGQPQDPSRQPTYGAGGNQFNGVSDFDDVVDDGLAYN